MKDNIFAGLSKIQVIKILLQKVGAFMTLTPINTWALGKIIGEKLQV